MLGLASLFSSYQSYSHPILKYSYFCVYEDTLTAMVVGTVKKLGACIFRGTKCSHIYQTLQKKKKSYLTFCKLHPRDYAYIKLTLTCNSS